MFGTVIDEQGFKVEFVHIFEDGTIDSYELKDGESVVEDDWQIANGMNKPQYTSNGWIDTDPLQPKPPIEVPPNKTEILEAEMCRLEIELLKMKKEMI